MRGLRGPDWNGLEDFEAIIENKRKPEVERVLRSAQPKVAAATQRYGELAPELEQFDKASLSEQEKDALLECYAPNR